MKINRKEVDTLMCNDEDDARILHTTRRQDAKTVSAMKKKILAREKHSQNKEQPRKK